MKKKFLKCVVFVENFIIIIFKYVDDFFLFITPIVFISCRSLIKTKKINFSSIKNPKSN